MAKQRRRNASLTAAEQKALQDVIAKHRKSPMKNPKRKKNPKSVTVSVSIPKGKRKGDRFVKDGVTYVVISFERNGKRIRFARKV